MPDPGTQGTVSRFNDSQWRLADAGCLESSVPDYAACQEAATFRALELARSTGDATAVQWEWITRWTTGDRRCDDAGAERGALGGRLGNQMLRAMTVDELGSEFAMPDLVAGEVHAQSQLHDAAGTLSALAHLFERRCESCQISSPELDSAPVPVPTQLPMRPSDRRSFLIPARGA